MNNQVTETNGLINYQEYFSTFSKVLRAAQHQASKRDLKILKFLFKIWQKVERVELLKKLFQCLYLMKWG
jgi:hypothetical protein